MLNKKQLFADNILLKKLRLIIKVNILWSSITKCRGHTKVNEKVHKALYNWVLHHPHIVH